VRIRSYRIPVVGDSGAVFRSATRFATDGTSPPPGTRIRTEWVAAFRIPVFERDALDAADPGQFVGPFRRGTSDTVVELLERGVHRYGRPARAILDTVQFKRWLSGRIRDVRPRCFSRTGHPRACPV
jgi:hypothetical protein